MQEFSAKLRSDRVTPADEDVGDGGPLDGAVATEGESRLAMDVLRISHVRAVITFVYGHVYSRPFGMRLSGKARRTKMKDILYTT